MTKQAQKQHKLFHAYTFIIHPKTVLQPVYEKSSSILRNLHENRRIFLKMQRFIQAVISYNASLSAKL